jgi:glycosyltransferase involved in cell wall biosynthesis
LWVEEGEDEVTDGGRGRRPTVRDRWPTVSVVIPTLNEARNLEHVLSRVPDDVFEIVLVDGWSTDDTVRVARRLRPDIRIIHQTRRGKGNALACGFHASRGDIIVMLDADGSADPAEIPRFVDALCQGAHFAKGTRFAAGGGSADITRLRRWGNRWLNRIVNVVHHTAYTDLCYGYNAFWSACLPYLGVGEPGYELPHGVTVPAIDRGQCEVRWGDGFEIETLLNVRVSSQGLRVTEVGSFESERLYGCSNLNAFRDGWRVLRTIGLERRASGRRGVSAMLPMPWEAMLATADAELVDLVDHDLVDLMGEDRTPVDAERSAAG